MVVAYPVGRNAARLPARNIAGIGDGGASLSLDFTLGYLSPLITFTRGSTGTYVNSSGLIATASTNVARFEYNPVTLAPVGVLIEDSKSNVCQQSETFDNATWTKTSSTVSADATTAPDGNVTADKIVEAAATASHLVVQARTVTTGNTYCFSVWLKAAERSFAFITLSGAGFSSVEAGISVNLSTGAVSTAVGSPVNSGTQTFPNGWYRVWFTYAATASSASNLNIYASADGVWANVSYAGDNTKGIYVWGAQMETQQFPSSYIATTTATVTRSVDIADITTLTPWYNTTVGTLFTQTYRLWPSVAAGTCGLASFNDNTASNRIYAQFQSSTSIRSQVTTGGGNAIAV